MNGISPRSRLYSWLMVCFVGSGMSGLIYELSWVRQLELVFGSTTYAVATVLAVFMGGLALGSFAMGRWIQRLGRYHPLRVYAVIELMIAALAFVTPYLIQAFIPIEQALWKNVETSFAGATLLRFGLSTLVLIVPTLLMGATLPLMSDLVSRDKQLSRHFVGWLYAANTAGAVLGCALAGLVLFPKVGLEQTQWIAMGLNGLAALGAWRLSQLLINSFDQDPSSYAREQLPGTRLMQAGKSEPTHDEARALVGMYAVSGFISMLYEVAWSRVLVLVLGSSIYAYTIMLSTFLLGLALGAWLGNRLLRNRAYVFHAVALVQVGVLLTTYLGVQCVEELPFLYLKTFEMVPTSPATFLSVQFLFAFGLMILPTIGLGAMFPIVLQGLPTAGSTTPALVGWAYAWNTLGAIGGSVVAGFWLVPLLGTQKTMLMGVLLNAALGAWAMSFMQRGFLRRCRRTVGAALLTIGVASLALTSPWDPAVMSSGMFRYAKDYTGLNRQEFLQRLRALSGEVLFFDEGLTCTVTVKRSRNLIHLAVNGKPDASVPSGLKNPFAPHDEPQQGDLGTQILLGQLPLLLGDKSDDVLVIGLGSGVTLGSVLTHPVKRVDCLELEHAVVEGSRFFEDYNRKPLADPRTHMLVNDARNHLLVSDRQYDVIISEPSNPWIPGAANLFTKEFFELSRKRLRDAGTFCLWLQMYEIEPEHFELILRTFGSVYPEMHLFRSGTDAVVLGSMKPLAFDLARLRAKWSDAVEQEFRIMRTGSVEDLLAHYWIGGKELSGQLSGSNYNTDDNRVIEFSAPLQVILRAVTPLRPESMVSRLYEQAGSGLIPHLSDPQISSDAGFWIRLSEASRRDGHHAASLRYARHALQLTPSAEAVRATSLGLLAIRQRDQALALLSEYSSRFDQSSVFQRARAEVLALVGQWSEVRSAATEWLRLAPADPRARYFLGISQFQLGQSTEALAAFEAVRNDLWEDRECKKLPFYLGTLLWDKGRWQEAAVCFETHLLREPQHVGSRLKWIDVLSRLGRESEALGQCQQLVQIASAAGENILRTAVASLQRGELPSASAQLEQARGLKPWDPDIALRLAYAQELQGDLKSATATLEGFLIRTPDRPQVLGYLSGLLEKQAQSDRAKVMADRYKVITGESWDGK
ncbi:MAG: fused MFS/spermidine synthase [Verrucomicrobiales bacterium]|nr:fused MFS/spermidine synthase [Verrucomicrobiales bacterium]